MAVGVVDAGVGFSNGACFARGLGGVVGVFSGGAGFALVGGDFGFVGVHVFTGGTGCTLSIRSDTGLVGIFTCGTTS